MGNATDLAVPVFSLNVGSAVSECGLGSGGRSAQPSVSKDELDLERRRRHHSGLDPGDRDGEPGTDLEKFEPIGHPKNQFCKRTTGTRLYGEARLACGERVIR